jgi:outer membrane protein OmpA-like peptidoglycan-associated protein
MHKLIISAVAAITLAACTSDPFTGQQRVSNTAIGTGAGAAVGALGGLIVGNATGANRRNSVLIGAGIGALTGGGIGLYQDRQAAKLRQTLQGTGVSVTRQGNTIILNMPSNITFASGSDNVKPQFYQVLNSVAIVLREFNRNLINVNGHTDSDGDLAFNQALSERRAVNVSRYLVSQNVNQARFYVQGFGETQPIASNASAAGKEQNRRVTIELVPLT